MPRDTTFNLVSEANRLLSHTFDALPNYHLAGIDRDVTDELLQRDGLLPTPPQEEGREQ